MKLTVQRVFDCTQVLAAIINEKRALPAKGAYRITRMHAQLFAEFSPINDGRTAKVMSYDHKKWFINNVEVPATEATLEHANAVSLPAVPDDKMPEFMAWWAEFAAPEIDVNVEPIPIDQLSIDGQESSISFAEFAVLGDLVRDD